MSIAHEATCSFRELDFIVIVGLPQKTVENNLRFKFVTTPNYAMFKLSKAGTTPL